MYQYAPYEHFKSNSNSIYIYIYIYISLPGTNKINHPDFLWTISEKSINFELLKNHQIVNHFDGINKLTTKSGFCEILHDLQWISCDKDDISPRCYNLGDGRHRDMFIDDYRISSLITILQVCICSCRV